MSSSNIPNNDHLTLPYRLQSSKPAVPNPSVGIPSPLSTSHNQVTTLSYRLRPTTQVAPKPSSRDPEAHPQSQVYYTQDYRICSASIVGVTQVSSRGPHSYSSQEICDSTRRSFEVMRTATPSTPQKPHLPLPLPPAHPPQYPVPAAVPASS